MSRLIRRTRRQTMTAVAAVSVAAARRRSLRWGSTESELLETLPGDDLLGRADLVSTRAITIWASPQDVWPWIAQLGQGRGGFYSYDVLENLIGCDIHSAQEVNDAWQDLAVGDQVRLHPEVSLAVSAVDPGRALVLRGGVPMGEAAPPYDMSWAFVLRDGAGGSTRLLVRERYAYRSWWAALVVEPVELASFVMSRRMLLGIKRRAEHLKASTRSGS
jgi:hypothetical protein